jgi:hypothetical protein
MNEFAPSSSNVSDWKSVTVHSDAPVVSATKAIRFPHIPSRARPLPGNSKYRLLNGHLMRTDDAHDTGEADRNSTLAAPASHEANPSMADSVVAKETPVPDAANVQQVTQILDYLRRKKDEIEAENSELAINTWQQQQWLLEQKEKIRTLTLAMRRTRSLVEALRCELIEMGHCLEEDHRANSRTFQHFNRLCEAFFSLHEEAQNLS